MCERSGRPPGRTCVLLLADPAADASRVAEAVTRELAGAVVHVVRTRHGYEQTLAAFEPDLVLSSCAAPDLPGPEAIALARRRAPRCAAVALAASVADEVPLACLRAGALDCVGLDRLERLGPALSAACASARARAEAVATDERRRAIHELLRLVAEHAPDLIAVIESTGTTYLSPSYRRLRAYGPGWLDVVHAEDRERVARAFLEGLERRAPWSTEHRALRDADGSLVELEARGAPVGDVGSGGVRTIVVSRDVTERRRDEAARRWRQEQRRHEEELAALGRLAGGVAHDYNNVLAAILGFSELLSRQLPANLREPVEEIRGAGLRAAALTRQLLLFSRRRRAAPEALDVAGRLRDAAPLIERLLGDGVRLVLELADDAGPAEVDPDALQQALLNLAVDARAAMQEGGTLTISARALTLHAPRRAARGEAPAGSWLELAVRDTGVGLDPQALTLLFDPLSAAGLGAETGLGLSAVWANVARGGGHVLVDSAPGQGTTVALLLPRAGPVPAALPVAPPAAGGTERLLVVDDDDAVRGLVCAALRDAGYDVAEARGGPEALEQLARGAVPPRLLVTDVVMPGLSGPELVRRARAEHPGLRVLFMSGYRPADESLLDPLLEKPFPVATLLGRVRALLDRAALEDA